MTKKLNLYLYLTWILTCISFLGSICLGEFQENYPCVLCWMQRLCMFPLAMGLGLIFAKQDLKAICYFTPFAALGTLLSFYHTALQEIPGLDPTLVCGMGPSCLHKHDLGLGMITLPMLSGIAFSVTLLMLFWIKKRVKLKLLAH